MFTVRRLKTDVARGVDRQQAPVAHAEPSNTTPRSAALEDVKKLELLLATMLNERTTASLSVQVRLRLRLRLRLDEATVQAQIPHLSLLLDRLHVTAFTRARSAIQRPRRCVGCL